VCVDVFSSFSDFLLFFSCCSKLEKKVLFLTRAVCFNYSHTIIYKCMNRYYDDCLKYLQGKRENERERKMLSH
jgi:hypothetical protein